MHTYVLCHKESLVQASLCFQTYLNIIVDVKNNKLLLRSITLTAKSSKKNGRRQVNENFYKLERYIGIA